MIRWLSLWGPVFGFMAAVIWLSDDASIAAPEMLSDKLLHLLAFFLFGLACMRAFHGNDKLKSYLATKPNEAACEAGLSKVPELLFCTPQEPNAGNFAKSLRAIEKIFVRCGLEGVFHVNRMVDGTFVSTNMLKQGGRITWEILDEWIDALTNTGVPLAGATRYCSSWGASSRSLTTEKRSTLSG